MIKSLDILSKLCYTTLIKNMEGTIKMLLYTCDLCGATSEVIMNVTDEATQEITKVVHYCSDCEASLADLHDFKVTDLTTETVLVLKMQHEITLAELRQLQWEMDRSIVPEDLERPSKVSDGTNRLAQLEAQLMGQAPGDDVVMPSFDDSGEVQAVKPNATKELTKESDYD